MSESPNGGQEPWERQDGEPDGAWAAFVAMRDLPLKDRSHARCASESGRKPSSVRTWSVTWKWKARLRAWDSGQDRAFALEMFEERRRLARRNIEVGELFIAKSMEGLSNLDGKSLSPSQIARLAEAGLRLQQMAVGSADSPVVTVQEQGRGSLRVEDPDAMMEAYKDPAVRAMAHELADRLAGRPHHPLPPRPGSVVTREKPDLEQPVPPVVAGTFT